MADELPIASSSSDSAALQAATDDTDRRGIRQELVDTAVRFLKNPKVQQTPVDQQKSFLFKKGLTSAEVNAALERNTSSPSNLALPNAAYSPAGAQYTPPPNTWRDYANVAVIVGGASYGAYRVLRSWILPRVFGVPDPEVEQMRRLEEQVGELQNSLKFVMDSVQQTLTAVQQQQDGMQRALSHIADKNTEMSISNMRLTEMKNDVNAVKSLLLGRSQFAPLPNEAPVLPAWQRANQPANQSPQPSRGIIMPTSPVNGHPSPVTNGHHNQSLSVDSLATLTSNGVNQSQSVDSLARGDAGRSPVATPPRNPTDQSSTSTDHVISSSGHVQDDEVTAHRQMTPNGHVSKIDLEGDEEAVQPSTPV